MTDWNPKAYLHFKEERARPALDLIARLGPMRPQKIFDLGCGPGISTALLRGAFPHAVITGVDSSAAMIDAARRAMPELMFELADAAQWRPPGDAELVFSNALFQWVPSHARVLAAIIETLRPGAVFAVQMPDNLEEPSHRLMSEVAAKGPWAPLFAEKSAKREKILSADQYYEGLSPYCSKLEIWRTTYHHDLPSHAAIANMLSTTGLNPFLGRLSEKQRHEFLAAYVDGLKSCYPDLPGGNVLYPFPRLFILAQRA
jgi:trans-aconitate 2-methyltransferase